MAQLLPSSNNKGGLPATPFEKVLRYGIPIGLGILIWKNAEYLLAKVLTIAELGFWGFVLFAIFGFILTFVVPNYKGIIREISKWFVKQRPLFFMENHRDNLIQKLKNLRQGIAHLTGEKKKLEEEKEEHLKSIEENLRMGAAAKEKGSAQASVFGMDAKMAKEDLKLANEDLRKVEASLYFMEKLHENWDASVSAMTKFIERMTRRYERLKRTAGIMKNSEEFLRDDTEDGRRYNMAVEAAKTQMANWSGYIEDFEKKAKPILEGHDLRKAVREGEGLEMIDEFMKSQLFLPDFNQITEDTTAVVTTASTHLPAQKAEFKFLKKIQK